MELELAYDILDILGTMQDAVRQMQIEYAAGNIQQFELLSMDLQDGLEAVREVAVQNIPKESRNCLADACVCALVSLEDIKRLILMKSEKVEWKLEYELLAFVETMTLQFYYWGIVDEHPEKREAFHAFVTASNTFRALKTPPENREYKFDLSICVVGYNHLDYTKRCVTSILENLPKKLRYELILINHGSNDGTKEYFESIEGAKVLNIAVNAALPGAHIKAYNGRYCLEVSNDVIIGENAIYNLYRSVAENRDYGYVVPTTPAVSNFQTIPASYHSREQFIKFVHQNNIYDEKRHEQRVRLCNPVTMMPQFLYLQCFLDLYEDFYCCKNKMSFPDDKISLWMRRHRYKNILAKDAYCHHFGSVTIEEDFKKEQEKRKFYQEGREAFYAGHGVDPWGPGFCYDDSLFEVWRIPIIDNALILGINCGLGSNSLKIKAILKETGAVGARLYNCVQDKRYLQDVKGVSDEAFLISDLKDVIVKTGQRRYNYIVVEEMIRGSKQEELIQDILHAGIEFDELAYWTVEGIWKIVLWKDIVNKKRYNFLVI